MSSAPLQVETVPIAEPIPDESNTRSHPKRNLDTIMASLRRFGQAIPIVLDARGVVRKGNGTLMAAKALGWETIQVVRLRLEGSEAAAFSITDNKAAELAQWETENLSRMAQQLTAEGWDLAELGWETYELDPLLGAEWKPPPVSTEDFTPKAAEELAVVSADEATTALFAEAAAKVRSSTPAATDAEVLRAICLHFLGRT